MAGKFFVSTLAAAALAACATLPAERSVTVKAPYVAAEHRVQKGPNGITGSAILRTVGGEAKTCTGLPVLLLPATPYVIERITAVYGRTDRGFAAQSPTFIPANPDYEQDAGLRDICDAQGNFAFTEVADGTYFVLTTVSWGVPMSAYYTAQQGGYLFARVAVSGGESKRVVLTQP